MMTLTMWQMTLMILHQMTKLMNWCEMATLTLLVLDNNPDELAWDIDTLKLARGQDDDTNQLARDDHPDKLAPRQ